MAHPLLIGKTADNKELVLLSNLANRHGLITGATGTGKTVTLQKMAEQFSRIGVPVFMADVKGDLSGINAAGKLSEKLAERLETTHYEEWEPDGNPTVFWDVYGEKGHPVRATISDMGPVLLAKLLNLNEVQSGVLAIIFRVADEHGLLLLDFKDLRAMTQFVSENAKSLQAKYGNIAQASIGAIQRGLLHLETQGGDQFFGEPMLDVFDLMRQDEGRGVINVLSAERLYGQPKIYSIFLLWALSELYERMPEVGDLEKPKLVFFFDEAHLLFKDAPPVLLEKIEQVVRLIRSKGVGIYFVTQNPLDIPDVILGQLGNRIQHALRAFTPKDQKSVKAAAQTMRPNPTFNTENVISNLITGEALISFLDEKGAPSVVERAYILAPQSRMGVLSSDELQSAINRSPLFGRYEEMIDRESAYEILQKEAQDQAKNRDESMDKEESSLITKALKEFVFGSTGPRGGKKDGLVQTASKSIMRKLSNEIVRGVLGGRKRR